MRHPLVLHNNVLRGHACVKNVGFLGEDTVREGNDTRGHTDTEAGQSVDDEECWGQESCLPPSPFLCRDEKLIRSNESAEYVVRKPEFAQWGIHI